MEINVSNFDAILCDLDGVITQTAILHAAAWKRLFDDYLKKSAARTGTTWEPFRLDEDYRLYVDGKSRYDGVRDFLKSLRNPFRGAGGGEAENPDAECEQLQRFPRPVSRVHVVPHQRQDAAQARAVHRQHDLAGELARGEGVTRRPASTYRLQLGAGFGFDQAAAVVPYLDALGITDVYLSPVLASAPGSTHGYDVVDHGRLDPELGGEEGYRRLAAACVARGMGILLDFVPNHMGIGPLNRWWMDVLENGPSSVHAAAFDVDWTPLKPELAHKVLVPVLGDQFGKVLERGELRLTRREGALEIRYFEHVFPLAPRSVPLVLRHRLDALRERPGADDPHVRVEPVQVEPVGPLEPAQLLVLERDRDALSTARERRSNATR